MRLWDKLKQMAGRFVHEVGEELGRHGVQGRAELGSAVFTGHSYVPYGEGQRSAGVEHGMEGYHGDEQHQHHHHEHEHEHERGGREE